MSGWSRFHSQFYETEYERSQRFQKQKAKLTKEGKCWQCSKTIEDCDCPNISRENVK